MLETRVINRESEALFELSLMDCQCCIKVRDTKGLAKINHLLCASHRTMCVDMSLQCEDRSKA